MCVCACISESDQGGFQQRQGWSTANCWSPSVSIDFAPRHRHAAAATVITANSRRTLVSLHIITMMHTTATDTTHIYTRRYNSHFTRKPFSAFSALTLFMGVRKSIRSVKIEWWVWLSVCSEVQIACIQSSWCHCIPKPDNVLLHLNSDWFYLSSTGLPRLSWKRGRISSSS